jgi:uncharacterized protein
VATSDRERVRELLGREPAGEFDVVVRDASGDPVVIRNAPLLDDGTPMPTRYWLVGADEVRAVSRLEADGGVTAAEHAVDAEELARAHATYAAERDAAVPAAARHRPSGGVGGTRRGVKCLHAHYAWYLAGGADPVGRWVAEQLRGPVASELAALVTDDVIALGTDPGTTWPLATHPRVIVAEVGDRDPPSPISLTNALGIVADDVDDLLREHDLESVAASGTLVLRGVEAWHLACVERGTAGLEAPVPLDRDDIEELFRTLATETRDARRHNPAIDPVRVDSIVATCCAVLGIMRRLHLRTARVER